LGVDERKGGAFMSGKTETLRFEAETKKLLDLMIHSIYSTKEIFLRELISNASDALDKRRFEALTRPEIAFEEEPEIRIVADGDARTLTLMDNGIGMSRQEVISNIGTIARSGTKEMLERLRQEGKADAPAELIGEFGVGFYSVFMVSDDVTIVTRKAGEETATLWESKGDGNYEIGDSQRDKPGTTVRLKLKPVDADDGLEDFTQEWVIRRIVKKYSDYVRYPIVFPVTRQKEMDGEKRTVLEDEVLNSQKAIWLRSESEVKPEEYNDFYKHISHDWLDPLHRVHMKVEGRMEYQALVFFPSHAPVDLYYKNFERGLQLFVKNVKILDKCEDILPDFLRFVRGVVDSPDLPLNVSREMLQQSKPIATIRSALTKKILSELSDLKKDENEKYLKFWKELGPVLKEGVSSLMEYKDKIVPLLLFESSHDAGQLTSLSDYVARMKEGQEDIYYMTGESRQAIEQSPHLEAFKDKGYEVLFMTDTVDEFITTTLTEFEGKKLRSAGKGDVEIGTKEEKELAKKELEDKSKKFSDLLAAIQKELDEDIKEVRLSKRLKDSPACLVSSEQDLSPHIERLLAQNKVDMPKQKRILELNPDHEIVQRLKARFDVRPNDLDLGDHAQILHGMALLAEGTPLPNPGKFAKLVAQLFEKSL
jgi:molecular chaperone HtpG